MLEVFFVDPRFPSRDGSPHLWVSLAIYDGFSDLPLSVTPTSPLDGQHGGVIPFYSKK